MNCAEHEKIYSGEYFCTNPPQYHWVCAQCAALGTDSFVGVDLPDFNKKKFDAIMNQKTVPWRPGEKQSVTCGSSVTVTFPRSDDEG